ncbi:MAG: hypothetical protein AAF211_34380, partial [Myxococcota bacterium]
MSRPTADLSEHVTGQATARLVLAICGPLAVLQIGGLLMAGWVIVAGARIASSADRLEGIGTQ